MRGRRRARSRSLSLAQRKRKGRARLARGVSASLSFRPLHTPSHLQRVCEREKGAQAARRGVVTRREEGGGESGPRRDGGRRAGRLACDGRPRPRRARDGGRRFAPLFGLRTLGQTPRAPFRAGGGISLSLSLSLSHGRLCAAERKESERAREFQPLSFSPHTRPLLVSPLLSHQARAYGRVALSK